MSPLPFSIRGGCFVAQKTQDDVALLGQEHKGRWHCRGILRRLPSAVRSIPFRRCHFLQIRLSLPPLSPIPHPTSFGLKNVKNGGQKYLSARIRSNLASK